MNQEAQLILYLTGRYLHYVYVIKLFLHPRSPGLKSTYLLIQYLSSKIHHKIIICQEHNYNKQHKYINYININFLVKLYNINQYSFMDELPCGFGEQPFVFPPDLEIQSLKKSCQCQCKDCHCQKTQSCCKTTSNIKQQKPIIPEKQPKTKMCFKCKAVPGVILYKGESMCQACSLRNVQYKCRVNLQNKIKITQNDKVVVCLSGGMNSICLGNILAELKKKFQKHLLFKSIEAVHVDISVLSQNQQEYRLKMKRIQQFCQTRDIPLKIIPLSQLIGKQQILKLLNNFSEGANQADIVDIFIEKLIKNHYKEQLLAFGTSGQRTASNILKFIVKGQGGSLQVLGWKSDRRILPLREHLTKQLQFYYYINKLDQYLVQPPSLFSKNTLNGINTINNVLEDFIDSLQDSYSHTCPTILRTSQKIKDNEKSEICSFCGGFRNGQGKTLCLRCERLKEYGKQGIQQLLPKDFKL